MSVPSVRRFAPWLCLLLLAASGMAARAAGDSMTSSVGTTLITLPLPPGTAEPSRSVPPLRLMGERMTPPSNRLLAMFISHEDEVRAMAGQAPRMTRYFMVQTLRQTEQTPLPAGEFAQVKTLLREQFQTLLAAAGPTVQGLLDKAAGDLGRDAGAEGLTMKIGEMKGLEVFDESATSISLLAITQVAVNIDGKAEEVPMAMAITTGTLKGKLVYFYAYSHYRGIDDLNWLREATRAWLPRAAALN